MSGPQLVMYPEEHRLIQVIVDRLLSDSNARAVFIVDKAGQLISRSGDDTIDTTSLASLTAGNIAATGGIAKLIEEKEFTTQFHEGKNQNIRIQLVGDRVILVIIFGNRSSLGLVTLRSKKASDELARIFETLAKKSEDPSHANIFSDITDDDINNLFND